MMSERMLGQVTVKDGNKNQAVGSGAQDGKDISIRLGSHPWIQRGGNYSLTTNAGESWSAICSGATGDHYYFTTY